MFVKCWPTVDFRSLSKGGKYAHNLCFTYLLFWQWKFSLVFTGCIVTSHWVPGHPTHLPCTEQYSVHCTVHCILYCTINCNQTSKWLAELTYLMRNNHFSASCILQLTLLYTVLNIIIHTVLYNTLYVVLYIVLYIVMYRPDLKFFGLFFQYNTLPANTSPFCILVWTYRTLEETKHPDNL